MAKFFTAIVVTMVLCSALGAPTRAFGQERHFTLIADVTGDGRNDIITVNSSTTRIPGVRVVVAQDLASPEVWLVEHRFHVDVAFTEDRDHDGRADLIIGSRGRSEFEWTACRSDGRAFYRCHTISPPFDVISAAALR